MSYADDTFAATAGSSKNNGYVSTDGGDKNIPQTHQLQKKARTQISTCQSIYLLCSRFVTLTASTFYYRLVKVSSFQEAGLAAVRL